MKIFMFFWRVAKRTFTLTAVFAVCMYLFAVMSLEVSTLAFSQFLLIGGFALIAAFAHELFGLRHFPLMLRVGVHFAVLLSSFLLLFSIAGKIQPTAGQLLIFATFFTVLYALLCTVTLLILRATGYYAKHLSRIPAKNTASSSPYANRFH